MQSLDEERRLEKGEVSFESRLRDAGVTGQLGEAHEIAGVGCDQAEQPRQVGETLDVRKVTDIALEEGGDVRPEPGVAAIRGSAGQSLRIASPADSRPEPCLRAGALRREGWRLAEQRVDEVFAPPVDLPLGERPEGEHFHPPHQRLGELGEQEDVRRAGQEKATECPVLTVTPTLNGPLLLRGPLAVEGAAAEVGYRGERASFCRCGASASKPSATAVTTGSGFTG